MNDTHHYLVTGGAGFIGSHVVGALLAEGNRVSVLDDLSTGRRENVAPFEKDDRFQLTIASITDGAAVDRAASDADIIIHLAAAVGVQLIVDHPVRTIETNISGTEQVLKAALNNRARVLIASTSEVYGKGAKIPFAEDDDLLLGPSTKNRWAYAASKLVDEFLGLAYMREHGLPVVIFRLFNTVGPGQRGRYGMVLPRFVAQAMRGDEVTVFGDGKQRRCFCDVRDSVPAILALATHPDTPGGVYNIGGNDEISIRELADRVIRRTGSSSPIRYVPYDQAYGAGFEDMPRRVPDVTRIQALLGWKPTITMDETIDAVAERLTADNGG